MPMKKRPAAKQSAVEQAAAALNGQRSKRGCKSWFGLLDDEGVKDELRQLRAGYSDGRIKCEQTRLWKYVSERYGVQCSRLTFVRWLTRTDNYYNDE